MVNCAAATYALHTINPPRLGTVMMAMMARGVAHDGRTRRATAPGSRAPGTHTEGRSRAASLHPMSWRICFPSKVMASAALLLSTFTGHPSLTPRAGFVQVAEARRDWAPDPAHPLPARPALTDAKESSPITFRGVSDAALCAPGLPTDVEGAFARVIIRATEPRLPRLRTLMESPAPSSASNCSRWCPCPTPQTGCFPSSRASRTW